MVPIVNTKSESSVTSTSFECHQGSPQSVIMNSSMAIGRKDWWQRSVVRRSASFVQANLEAATDKSPFLQRPPLSPEHMAYFNRSEIRTGQLLGQGGFSVVYEILAFALDDSVSDRLLPTQREAREHFAATALDPDTKQGRYVIKHLKDHLLECKEEFTRAASDMALEAAYLSRIHHEHILPLRGLPVTGLEALEDGRHDGYFLILDRLQDTLDHRITQWQTGEDELLHRKLSYAQQLASAVSYLHRNHILFRDLKPQNIGIDSSGQIRLFDFGLCREIPGEDMDEIYEMSGVGTRRYQAPEIVLHSRYNAKADVYGWAMVTWEMMTGDKPFVMYSCGQHYRKVCMEGERPDLTKISDPIVVDLLQKSWCSSIENRLPMTVITSYLDRLLSLPESHQGADSFVQRMVSRDSCNWLRPFELPNSVSTDSSFSSQESGSVLDNYPARSKNDRRSYE